MKKMLAVLVLSLLAVTAVSAQEGKPFIGLDIYGGATFEFGDNWISNDDSLVGGLNFMAQVLTSLRVGGGADLYFRIAGPLSVGAEAGLFVFATSDDSGNTTVTPLLDIPVRATVRLTFNNLALQVHGGYNFSTTFNAIAAASSYMDIHHKLDLGGKLYLGAFYIEYSRLFWKPDAEGLMNGSNRVGLGINLNLF